MSSLSTEFIREIVLTYSDKYIDMSKFISKMNIFYEDLTDFFKEIFGPGQFTKLAPGKINKPYTDENPRGLLNDDYINIFKQLIKKKFRIDELYEYYLYVLEKLNILDKIYITFINFKNYYDLHCSLKLIKLTSYCNKQTALIVIFNNIKKRCEFFNNMDHYYKSYLQLKQTFIDTTFFG